MSLNSFIPTLWADTLLAATRRDLVFGNLVNRDYEGQISRVGDTVKINGIGDITIFNYTKDTPLPSPQALSDAQTVLTITQAKAFNFEVDDVDAAQQQPKVMGEAMSWAGYKIALTIDNYLAGFYTEASASNLVGTAAAPVTVAAPTQANMGAGTTVYDKIVTLSQKLTEAEIPRRGRWAVIPAWGKTHLTQDARFTGFNTPPARATIESYGFDPRSTEAFLGVIDGMDVYESLNAPHIGGGVGVTGAQDAFIAGHSMAWTFADGIVKVEAFRPPDKFADAVKGLHLYGAKVTRPNSLAVAYLQMP